jgi:hypothetical protein
MRSAPLPDYWNLRWADVDPAHHRFDPDPGAVLAVVRRVLPPIPTGTGWTERYSWLGELTDALVAHYGPWAALWRGPANDGTYDSDRDRDGVGWCCVDDSITTPAETSAAVATSLILRRRWLERLAEQFDRFLPLPGDDARPGELLDAWEVAIAQLINLVAGHTGGEDGGLGTMG